tara:strand:- start:1630 stop:1980 length:351 start_codon:yes stop_codon:yes gene_type:complete
MNQVRNKYMSREFLASERGRNLIAMIHLGYSDKEVADRFGFATYQVQRVRLRKLGIRRTTVGQITNTKSAPTQQRPDLDFKITLTEEQASILSKLAEAEYRSLDNQLLYLLSKVLK